MSRDEEWRQAFPPRKLALSRKQFANFGGCFLCNLDEAGRHEQGCQIGYAESLYEIDFCDPNVVDDLLAGAAHE